MLVSPCPLCRGTNRYYSFLMGQERFDECWDCGLLQHKSTGGKSADDLEYEEIQPEEAVSFALNFFDLLRVYIGTKTPALNLKIGLAGKVSDALGAEGARRGFDLEPLFKSRGHVYDILILSNLLESTKNPVEFVQSLREHIKADGTLVIITKKLIRPGSSQTKERLLAAKQRYSFSDLNLQTILYGAGFENSFMSHSHNYKHSGVKTREWSKEQAVVFGRKVDLRHRPLLSIVLPVYNEIKTVSLVMDALLAKKMPSVDKEIIVVESASTDGSREEVLKYQQRQGVKIILQDRPQGKGFAVREGLTQASGDIVLIQDADLEYDLMDYEMLLSPILMGRADFVLGTRHAGNWKIRQFNQYFLADFLNFGHWFLVYLMNLFYSQKMTDPFTMFKVFRRDCLFGLQFECNRFDFDVELVCKLLRKGYHPLEIPINYRARSFSEGKKVRIFRDPLTWIKAIFKCRYTSVFHLANPRPEKD